ncbi:carbon-nitrogen hydrolase family protein [Brevibacillus fluminis]|nr:carbon-nitrogen hydrolase family protein [Brevibacillus fluminis]
MSTLTLALAQLRVTPGDKESNLERALETIHSCIDKEVDYVLFPEQFLTGYFVDNRIRELAEPVDGPSIHTISQAAKKAGIGVIFGFPEREGERIYNSAAFIEKTGECLGVYRKTHLFGPEVEVFTQGEACPIFPIAQGNIGLMMTFDMAFPEVSRLYALQGAHVVMVLNAHIVPYQPYQEIFLRARALENQFFIAAVNKVGLEKNTLFFGESTIVSPDGVHLYKAGNDEEIGVITIDLGDVRAFRETKPMKYMEKRRQEFYQRFSQF